MTKPESCRIVYKKASGFQPEPEQESKHKQYDHTVATPIIPQNLECRAFNTTAPQIGNLWFPRFGKALDPTFRQSCTRGAFFFIYFYKAYLLTFLFKNPNHFTTVLLLLISFLNCLTWSFIIINLAVPTIIYIYYVNIILNK